MIHLDTSFLVDLLRERRRGEGPATAQLRRLEDVELRVSVHVLCELYAGVELSDRAAEERVAVEALISGCEVVYPGAGFAPTYGRLLSHLQKAGIGIATMDLLIATAAVLDAAPILTANARRFERVPDLQVSTYDSVRK